MGRYRYNKAACICLISCLLAYLINSDVMGIVEYRCRIGIKIVFPARGGSDNDAGYIGKAFQLQGFSANICPAKAISAAAASSAGFEQEWQSAFRGRLTHGGGNSAIFLPSAHLQSAADFPLILSRTETSGTFILPAFDR